MNGEVSHIKASDLITHTSKNFFINLTSQERLAVHEYAIQQFKNMGIQMQINAQSFNDVPDSSKLYKEN